MSYQRPDSTWSSTISDKVCSVGLSLADTVRCIRLDINFAISHLDDIEEAYKLIKDLEPTTPQVFSPPNAYFCFIYSFYLQPVSDWIRVYKWF